MYYSNIETTQGLINEPIYNVVDFPYTSLLLRTTTCHTKGRHSIEYYNIPCAFDIETTTIETPQDEKGKYIYNPYAFMYQWQACVIDTVVFGNTWQEFQTFLNKLREYFGLTDYKRLVIYVHNLAYEFQFMKEFIEIDSMFSRDKRKPIKIISKGIEFRCSYFLSNMSLSKFCENSKCVTHYKLIDTYDYRLIRTPTTKLTQTETSYCYNDVRGLCECITYLLNEDTIASIPLTNTGYVRRDCRKAMQTNPNNRRLFEETKLDIDLYRLLKLIFRGGNTHANRIYSNTILKHVYSFDISSSYPSRIALCYFPISKFTKINIDTQTKLDKYLNRYCCAMKIKFFNIQVKDNISVPYIDISHCIEHNGIVNDNGRVLKANYIEFPCTEIDLNIIRETYDYDGFIVDEIYISRRGKLPKELVEIMMKYYTDKTQLKGINEKEYEYAKSKNKLNAIFGMMVSDIIHNEYIYNIDTMEWEEMKASDSSLDDFYNSRNNFLPYQWGIWITAHARRILQDMINVVGIDLVYTDTDSIKFINEEHIQQFEEKNIELIRLAEDNEIKAYAERDGIKYYMGTWDNDGTYERFITLGAKKYAYETLKNDKTEFHITVSGMNKKQGAKVVKTIENFEIGRTYADVGRTVAYYNDERIHTITINGEKIITASNIGIVDTTYTLGVTREYWELIGLNPRYMLA